MGSPLDLQETPETPSRKTAPADGAAIAAFIVGLGRQKGPADAPCIELDTLEAGRAKAIAGFGTTLFVIVAQALAEEALDFLLGRTA